MLLSLIIKCQLISLVLPSILAESYLEIPPVKLLTVTSVADRFPAAGAVTDGGYRTNIENGFVSKYYYPLSYIYRDIVRGVICHIQKTILKCIFLG